MPTNGELRFRLNCTDGSAYIRTQTAADKEGWQNPHFHLKARETYIVEHGWIGYAELVAGQLALKRYETGDVFTTSPGVVHNIFMPNNAVIHTVKHGGGPRGPDEAPDWYGGEKHPETGRLAELHGKDFSAGHSPARPQQPQGAISPPPPPSPTSSGSRSSPQQSPPSESDPEKTYNAAYRHFDTLIWQAPTWSSALFALVVASVNSLLTTKASGDAAKLEQQTSNSVAVALTMTTHQFASAQLALFGIFTLVLAYALYRFRWHQIGVKNWANTPSSPKVSPQVLLQIVIVVEGALLLFVSATLAGVPVSTSIGVLALALGYCTYRWESKLAARNRSLHPRKLRATDAPTPSVDQGGS